MKIDLSRIFHLQLLLDKKIHHTHHVNYHLIINELKLALCVELAELANEIRSFKFWSKKQQSPKEIILEEYVDGIHFITSLAIYHVCSPFFYVKKQKIKFNKKQITKKILKLISSVEKIENKKKLQNWYLEYLELGFQLGFTNKEINDAYVKKNKINWKRQNNNY